MGMSRRSFISAGVLGAGVVPDRTTSVSAELGDYKGSLLAFGIEGRLLGRRVDYQEKSSALLQVDLQSGQQRITKVPIAKAHIAQSILPGRILCMPQNWPEAVVVDANHEVIATLRAPAGFLYSGHALVLPSGDHVALPLCQEVRLDGGARGAVEIISLSNLKRVDLVQNWGFNPHELQYCQARGEVVVADYGTLTRSGRPLFAQFGRPAIFTCDPQSLAVKRVHEQNEFAGAPTHLRVDITGSAAYFILQQAAYVNVHSKTSTYEAELLASEADMQRILGLPPRDYVLAPDDYRSPELSAPRPLVRLDLSSGMATPFMVAPRHHLKPQSVERNDVTGFVVASYTASDVLVLHRGRGVAKVLDGADVGVSEIRGLADIPGSPFIAVSGSDRNLSIVDLRTCKSVRIFGTRNYASPHLTFAPWA